MSSIDKDPSHVQTSKPVFTADLMKALTTLSTVGSIAGTVIQVYQFLDTLISGDPIVKGLNQIIDALESMMQKDDADQIDSIKNTFLSPRAQTMDAARAAIKEYEGSQSALNQDVLSTALTAPDGLHAALMGLLAGYHSRFIPSAYRSEDGKTPAWVHGRYVMFQGNMLFPPYCQVYEQASQTLDSLMDLPAPLIKTQERWDCWLCLKLIYDGLPIWRSAFAVLEPFYELTGQWTDRIQAIATAMDSFEANWRQSRLWTREMPSWSQIQEATPHPPHSYSTALQQGFREWPMGVLDPITGVERANLTWWKSKHWLLPELMTDAQRNVFTIERANQLYQLEADCGLKLFNTTKDHVRRLRVPPLISPSLLPHSELLEIKYSSPAVGFIPVKQVEFKDDFGTVWTGHLKQLSVTATVPVSLQSNPKPAPPLPPRAVSDVELGYEVTVTPTGGKTQKNEEWVWPVRRDLEHVVPSLYHQIDGALRTIPYATTKKFVVPADTWETITDGIPTTWEHRNISQGTVAFTMTVTVVDRGLQILGDEALRRGAISIKIEADNSENQNRSFGLTVTVTETAAVDANGRRDTDPEFSGYKKYTASIQVPIDICRIIVPSEYFHLTYDALQLIRDDSKERGIPGPEPDPDPILELSVWRVILEKNPVLLQSYVRRVRELTGRPSLTAQHALADLDRIIEEPLGPTQSRANIGR